jgi:hypothetical protein
VLGGVGGGEGAGGDDGEELHGGLDDESVLWSGWAGVGAGRVRPGIQRRRSGPGNHCSRKRPDDGVPTRAEGISENVVGPVLFK